MVNESDRCGVVAHLSILCDASIGQNIHTLLVTGALVILPSPRLDWARGKNYAPTGTNTP